MAGFVIMQRMFELMASAIPASKKIEEFEVESAIKNIKKDIEKNYEIGIRYNNITNKINYTNATIGANNQILYYH